MMEELFLTIIRNLLIRYLNFFSNLLEHKRGVVIEQLNRILFLSYPKFHEKNIFLINIL